MPLTVKSSPHRYVLCLNYEGQPPIPFELNDPPRDVPEYFARTLETMDRLLIETDTSDELTIYLTWKLNELPSYGRNVVAVVLGDEWARIPAYADEVLATFKCYGTRPPMDVGLRPTHLNAMRIAKQLRTMAHWLPGWTASLPRRLRTHLRNETRPPIHAIPLGYGNQLDLPVRPLSDRAIDVFFAGSVEHRQAPPWSLGRWVQSPKTLARQAMIDHLRTIDHTRPDLTVVHSTPSSFAWNALHYGTDAGADVLDADGYSARMMNTKICLVPRGTSLETFRYFEALRYGCIPVTERLPDRWFYTGAPGVCVDDWSELPALVDRLLADPAHLDRLHREALAWWNNVCAPEAVGRFIAEQIEDAQILLNR
jgi:hypothetical protein